MWGSRRGEHGRTTCITAQRCDCAIAASQNKGLQAQTCLLCACVFPLLCQHDLK